MRVMLIATILAFATPAVAKVKFLRDVKPILENHCVRCHGDSGAMKGLRVDKKERAMLALVAKKPDESRIYLAAKTGFMPPGQKKLSPAELETLRRWIAEGAKWPKGVELVGKNPFATDSN
ncbi:MAG TPA: c-type cytochrome domain-containing protein [Bryobacteraceae bacterium]|jgi:mono/diheme cytochrome c family protein|nr:c-type cytochrome domain-containing protein [Bryobacteraceae bacterium]